MKTKARGPETVLKDRRSALSRCVLCGDPVARGVRGEAVDLESRQTHICQPARKAAMTRRKNHSAKVRNDQPVEAFERFFEVTFCED